MKKLMTIVLLAMLAFTFTSCEKDELNDVSSVTYYITYLNSVSSQPEIEIFTGEANPVHYVTLNNISQPMTISLTDDQLSLITNDTKRQCIDKSSVVKYSNRVLTFYVIIDGEKFDIPF